MIPLQEAVNVILDGLRASLEPDWIDRHEEKVLREQDERRLEGWKTERK